MKGYDDIEEPARADTEITLGPRSILGIFFALALICGVFFGFGYSLGRSGGAKSAAAALSRAQPASTSEPATPLRTVVEPLNASASAGSSGNPPSALPPADTSAPPKPPAATAATAATQTTLTPSAQPAAYNPAPAIKAVAIQQEAAHGTPKPASLPAEIMVQIAAVARRRDAEALVAALRERGYTPVIRPGVDDHLLHVQVGPFATRTAARAMRARLLHSGYNAILK